VSEWIGAEARRRPLLIALEDLHWGDPATVNYLARALREHPELPWMVLALARPEVDEVFPKLWSDAAPRRMDLPALGRRAAEQLVRAVLGDDVSAETLGRIIERAGGNAFYLEELIRHAAEGGGELPDTVLAMVQSRLEGLEPEARRVLQVASVFGETFREAGVEALLGGESAPMDVGGWLEHLVDVELLEHNHGADAGPGELTFRHALVRDAAYALIADGDKRAAHLAAAEWLEQQPAIGPHVLIEHFERAGAPEHAVRHYLHAAREADAAGDFEASCSLCERGRNAGAEGEVRGELGLIEGYAWGWLDRWDRAILNVEEALPLLAPASPLWCQGAGGKVYIAACLGRPELALGEVAQLMAIEEIPDATGRTGHAMAMVVFGMAVMGQTELARRQVRRMEDAARRHTADPSFLGWLHWAGLQIELGLADDPVRGLSHVRQGADFFSEAGNPVGVGGLRVFLAQALLHVGATDRAMATCAPSEMVGQPAYSQGVAALVVCQAQVELGENASAAAGARRLLTAGTTDIQVFAVVCLAEVELGKGEYAPALQRGLEAMEVSFATPGHASVLEVVARAHLALGDPASSFECAQKGVALCHQVSVWPRERAGLLLVNAEALMALGREDEAREAIRVARDRLLRIHATVPDDLKDGYLTGLRAHRRTMELARDWLGEG
jgi:eukaryotic-like serine/threonine-protein kinase